MVLEIAWLRILGPILWDFTNQHMAFTLCRRHVWTGVGAPGMSTVLGDPLFVHPVTTRHMWFFDILLMSKYMKLFSQLKVYDIRSTKIETSKNQRHKVIM